MRADFYSGMKASDESAKGFGLYLRGDNEGALECYNKALSLDPSFRSVYPRRYLALMALGRVEEASRSQEEGALSFKKLSRTHLDLVPREKREERKVVASSSGHRDAELCYGTGLANQILGLPEEALRSYEECLSLNPAHEKAKEGQRLIVLDLAKRKQMAVISSKDIVLSEKYEGLEGNIYRANWIGRPVAVKLLRDKGDSSQATLKKVAECHANLAHPNVLSLLGVCVEVTKLCVVIELISETTLHTVLQGAKALPWSVRLSIAIGITKGLAYLHENKYWLRHLNTSTVVLDEHMHPKLMNLASVERGASESSSAREDIAASDSLTDYRMNLDLDALALVLQQLSRRSGMAVRSMPVSDALIRILRGEIKFLEPDKKEPAPLGFTKLLASLFGDRKLRPKTAEAVLDSLTEVARTFGAVKACL